MTAPRPIRPICLLALLGAFALAGAEGCAAQSAAAGAGQEKKEQQVESIARLPKGKKLVLKDGTYQLARSYEKKDGRVRYWSIERSAWEELPAELVDWEATRKAEEEDARQKQEITEKIRTIQQTERAEEVDVDASLELAPGVFLPDAEGLYLVEAPPSGHGPATAWRITPMAQVGTEIKLDKGRALKQVLVPIPVIPTRHKVQIPGKSAKLRVTTPQPEFYIRTADNREPEIELIRAQVKGNERLVEFIDTNLVGEKNQQRNTIPVQRWKMARGVYRLTLGESLEPGEYALAEVLPEGAVSLYVWDFGADVPATVKAPAKK